MHAGNGGAAALACRSRRQRPPIIVSWRCLADTYRAALFKAKVAAALQEGNSEARIVDSIPDSAFKDWNDQIRGVIKADTEAAKAAARAEAEAAAAIDAAQRRREEEAPGRRLEADPACDPLARYPIIGWRAILLCYSKV